MLAIKSLSIKIDSIFANEPKKCIYSVMKIFFTQIYFILQCKVLF